MVRRSFARSLSWVELQSEAALDEVGRDGRERATRQGESLFHVCSSCHHRICMTHLQRRLLVNVSSAAGRSDVQFGFCKAAIGMSRSIAVPPFPCRNPMERDTDFAGPALRRFRPRVTKERGALRGCK
jgi:hypothetical protein